ncbi:acyl-CoA thioesterase domain-containing protein [Nocardioides convexus]|uniref:acyl-CoA thioesterase domain-containing protein n=1 Tax=Nocardioides convexus TaxID=2712224 RepID=UPI0024188EF3|nr:acyl-CoA thioesterase domain-containing protein [Nocardioides convexus]
MAYWHRTSPHTFTPTEHVGGAWDRATQHIAPALGVLAHEVERDLAARRGGDLVVSRLSYDILGTVPIEPIDVAVEVLRPGRTIEPGAGHRVVRRAGGGDPARLARRALRHRRPRGLRPARRTGARGACSRGT